MQITTRLSWVVTFIQKIKLEYIALPIFIALSLFVYQQRYFSYIFLVLAAAVGTVLFIVLGKYFTREDLSVSVELPDEKAHTVWLFTSSLFFLFYGLSFLTLLQGFYTKTIWYYVFVSLCAGLIAAEIFVVKTKAQGTFNLLKSFLLVLNITLSNQILFSQGIGLPDLNGHLYEYTEPIINRGYIAHVGGYEYFPIHHILSAINILIYGTDLKMTYLYLGGFVVCLGMLFVFLIGRKFVSLHFGLFAALVYTSLDYLIMYGSHPVHQAYNYFFTILLFAVILYINNKRDYRFSLLYTILVIVIVFTHHYSAMIVFIVLSTLIIVEIIQRLEDQDYKLRTPSLCTLYGVILFAQWIYYSRKFGSFLGIFKVYQGAITEGTESLIAATAYDALPYKTVFLNTMGSSILIALSVIGFLYLFKNLLFFFNSILMLSVALSILLGIGVTVKVQWLLPDRMYPFLQQFGLVFLGSTGIIWISKKCDVTIKQKIVKMFPIFGIVICLVFFSLSSTIAGFETSLFGGEKTSYYKLYETPYESNFNQWRAANIRDEFLFSMDTEMEKYLDSSGITLQRMLEYQFTSRGVALPERPAIVKAGNDKWSVITRTTREPWYIVLKEDGQLNVYNSTKILNRLPVTMEKGLDIGYISKNTFVVSNKFYLMTGYVRSYGSHLGQHSFIRIKEDELYVLEQYERYYDNGMVNLYYNS